MDEHPDRLLLPDKAERFAHGGVAVHYVPHEVLVHEDDVREARRALDRFDVDAGQAERIDDRLGVARLPVADRQRGRRLHVVLGDLHDRWPEPLRLQLHHYLHASPHIHVWPGALPAPVDTVLAPPDGAAGRGVTVAVLDTGVASHPWLGAARAKRSDDEGDPRATVADGTILSPLYGHGTFVAGVVHRGAPGATILGRRLPLEHSMCRADRAAAAVLALIEDRPDVVNLSWGCYTLRNLGTLVVEQAVKALVEALPGVAVVAAAGNDGVTVPMYPAAQKGVVAVGAVAPDGRRADVAEPFPHPFDHWASNFGPWVDQWAPGVGVIGPYPPVPRAARGLVTYDGRPADAFDGGFARWSGTSFAAPAVAAAIAAATPSAGTAAKAAGEVMAAARATGGVIDLRTSRV